MTRFRRDHPSVCVDGASPWQRTTGVGMDGGAGRSDQQHYNNN